MKTNYAKDLFLLFDNFNITEDMFDDVTQGLSDTYLDLQADFVGQLYIKLSKQVGTKASVKKDDVSITELFDALDENQLAILGIDKTTKRYFEETSETLAHIFDDKFIGLTRKISKTGRLHDIIGEVFQHGDIDTQLNKLLLGQKFKGPTGKTIKLDDFVMVGKNPF